MELAELPPVSSSHNALTMYIFCFLFCVGWPAFCLWGICVVLDPIEEENDKRKIGSSEIPNYQESGHFPGEQILRPGYSTILVVGHVYRGTDYQNKERPLPQGSYSIPVGKCQETRGTWGALNWLANTLVFVVSFVCGDWFVYFVELRM